MTRHRLRTLLLLVPFVVLAWYLVAWVRHVPAEEPVAVIAHRGAPATSGAPEGTLAAFRAAIDGGADWLELDVRTTADGALVVLHDATVDRTTDGTGPVSALTLAEVRALDAGGGARIPTLEEVVSLAKEAGLPVLPEIKDGPQHPSIAPALVDLLRASDYLDRAVIQAFEPEILERIRELAPDARTCWLTGWWRLDVSSPPVGATHVCPMGEMLLLNPDLIRGAHEAGLIVFAWWDGLESPLTNRILGAYGVDGIMVDDLGSAAAR